MKRHYWKRTIKILSLILAVVLCVSFLQTFVFVDFWQQGQGTKRIRGFYMEPKNSLDVVLIGDSTIYSGFSPGYAYELQGITTYNYAIGANTCNTWKPITEEILRRQSPQLIVVEIGATQYRDLNKQNRENSTIHTLIDNMPPSLNKLRAIRDLVGAEEDASVLEFLFPFIRYHSVWEWFGDLWYRCREMLYWRFVSGNILKGDVTRPEVEPERGRPRGVGKDRSAEELSPESEAVLREYLEYCREKDLNVLFIAVPIRINDENDLYETFMRENRAGEIVQEYGFEFLNLNYAVDEIGLEHGVSFYNDGHLNYRGQLAFTEYFSRLLTEEYGVHPHTLTDSQRTNWDECAEYTRLFFEYAESLADKPPDEEPLSERIEVMRVLDAMRSEQEESAEP